MTVQVTVQILILLLFKTETPTTGGLTTIFNQTAFGLDPVAFFVLSTSWSLLSCVRMHTTLISLEKGFCKFSSQFFIFLWGTFAILRRVLSLVAFFIPSLGLFSLLYHFEWDQVPFKARLDYALIHSISPNNQIKLFGLNETIYWSGLDRWDYTDPHNPTAPHYSTYTLLSLKETFLAGAGLLAVHILSLLFVKILTSPEFRRKGNLTSKLVHIIENINYSTPYSDWDAGVHTIQEYEVRFRRTVKEMIATFTVNILVTALMMIPIFYTGIIIIIGNGAHGGKIYILLKPTRSRGVTTPGPSQG